MRIILLFHLIVSSVLAGQDTSRINTAWSHSLSVSVGRTWFDFNSGNFAQYPTVEARLGWKISRYLSNQFSLKSGLLLTMRAKRSSHLNGQLYTGPGMLLLRVDETASKLNHFSLEIPLLIEYCLINRPLSFQLGLRARDWQATDLKGDILKSRKEIGVAGGIFHNLNKKLAVGFDWYSSLTKLYNGAIYDTSGNLIAAFSLRNQSILGTLEYRIGK